MGQVAGVLDDPSGREAHLQQCGGQFARSHSSQGTHLLSVGRLIIVSDQAYHRCVISKFDDDIGTVCSCTVVCVQGVQE